MKTNLKIVCDCNDPSKLPIQLVIRKGRVVVAETGEPPVFPETFANGGKSEGVVVSIVPRDDLAKVMQTSKNRRRLLSVIAHATAKYG